MVLNYEFTHNINDSFATLGPNARVKSRTDVIAFNQAHRETELPYVGQERLVLSEATAGLDAPEYTKAVTTIQRATRQDGIGAVMPQHRLDALVAPTSGAAWLIDHTRSDRFDGGHSAGTTAIAGHPDISVPMGLVAGLPVGCRFRPRVERAHAAQNRLRLRTGVEAAPASDLRSDARLNTRRRECAHGHEHAAERAAWGALIAARSR